MKNKEKLTDTELLSLDLLIAIAQKNGHVVSGKVDPHTQEQAEAQAQMWDARHSGIEVGPHDREILLKIKEFASQLKFSPSLQQLIETRAKALRNDKID